MKQLSRVRTEESAKRVIQRGEGISEIYNPRTRKVRYRVAKQRGGGFLPILLVPVLTELASIVAEKGVKKAYNYFTGTKSEDAED